MSKAPTSFQTVQDVINIQNSVLSAISGGNTAGTDSEGKTLLERIKARELEELKALKEQIEQKENDFFVRSGINSFEELHERTKAWMSSGASRILQDAGLISEIQHIFEETLILDLETVAFQFQNQALTEEQMVKLFGEEIREFVDSAGNIVSVGLKNQSASRSGTLSLDFHSSKISDGKKYTKSFGQKGITFFQRSKSSKKHNNIEIHFTKGIPTSEQHKLKNKMNDILKELGIQSKATTSQMLHEKIGSKILSYLPSDSYPEANASIDKIIQNFLVNSYDIKVGKNSSVIRGALGEIYWNAFFDFIGLSGTSPVGLSVKSINNKEIPVDILYEKFGFQVKNYTTIDGIVTFNQHFDRELKEMVPNQISFHQFFSNSLEMGTGAGELLGKFYFSKSYNVRDEKKDPDGKFIPIENRFVSIEGGIHSYIKANQDKLLNINRQVSLKTPDLFEIDFDPGKPIIFFINEKPILASAMIQEIINSLDSKFDGTVYIKIQNLFINSSGFSTGAHWDEPISVDISSISKDKSQAFISYTIDVNVSGLLQKILG